MPRGKVDMHNCCYEPEDFEAMLSVSHGFGFCVRVFHNAIEALQVPKLLKACSESLNIARFTEFAFYKQEPYSPTYS